MYVHIHQNDLCMVTVSYHIFISPHNENNGYTNVAGVFCSKKKCPTHAKKYAVTSGTTPFITDFVNSLHDSKYITIIPMNSMKP